MLERQGVKLGIDDSVHYSIDFDHSLSSKWIISDECPLSQLSIDTDFVSDSHRKKDETIAANDGTKADDGFFSKDPKGQQYFTLTGLSPGTCNFRVAFAQPGNFRWETLDESVTQTITIPVTIVAP